MANDQVTDSKIQANLRADDLTDRIEDELQETVSTSSVKDHESGFIDRDKIMQLIQEASSSRFEGWQVLVSSLQEQLQKIESAVERDIDLNEKNSIAVATIGGDVESIASYEKEEERYSSSLKDSQGDAEKLFSELIDLGILTATEMGSELIKGIQSSFSSYGADKEDLKNNPESLEKLNEFTQKQSEVVEELKKEGAIIQSDEVEKDGLISIVHTMLLPKDYQGEMDLNKMTKEDIVNINASIQANPENVKTHTFAAGDNEIVQDLARDNARNLVSEVLDVVSRGADMLMSSFTGMFSGKESSQEKEATANVNESKEEVARREALKALDGQEKGFKQAFEISAVEANKLPQSEAIPVAQVVSDDKNPSQAVSTSQAHHLSTGEEVKISREESKGNSKEGSHAQRIRDEENSREELGRQ